MTFLCGNGVLIRGHQNGYGTKNFYNREKSQRHNNCANWCCAVRAANRTDSGFQCDRSNDLYSCCGQIYSFTAGIGISQLFSAAEKCLSVAFTAVENHIFAGIGCSGQEHRTAACPFICHKFYPKRIGQVNRIESAVERYRFNIHADVGHTNAPAFDHCNILRQCSSVHENLDI